MSNRFRLPQRGTRGTNSTAPTGHRIPAQSNALGRHRPRSPRSEGTPQIVPWRTRARSTPLRRSFRTHKWYPTPSQGFTLGWYALPLWGTKSVKRQPCRNHSPTFSSIWSGAPRTANYEIAAEKELGKDYPKVNGDDRSVPLALWYAANPKDVPEFEKQMRRKVHYVVQPSHLWNSIANMARTQSGELLNTLQAGFKYIETESFESTFRACSPRSTSVPPSWARSTRTGTPSSAPSSRRSPRG